MLIVDWKSRENQCIPYSVENGHSLSYLIPSVINSDVHGG